MAVRKADKSFACKFVVHKMFSRRVEGRERSASREGDVIL